MIQERQDDMALPDGKTCADCFHFHRCINIGYSGDKDDVRCSFMPSRFIAANEVPQASPGDVEAHVVANPASDTPRTEAARFEAVVGRAETRESKSVVGVGFARELERENALMREALKAVHEWYERDGSVGGCSLAIDCVEKALKGGKHE